MTTDAFEVFSGGCPPHVVHRQQQRSQRFDGGQEVIGDDLNIVADVPDLLQQSETIQRAQWMVGDNHYPPFGGNPGTLSGAYVDCKVEVFERPVYESHALKPREIPRELGESRLIKQVAEKTHEAARHALVARHESRVTRLHNLANIQHVSRP